MTFCRSSSLRARSARASAAKTGSEHAQTSPIANATAKASGERKCVLFERGEPSGLITYFLVLRFVGYDRVMRSCAGRRWSDLPYGGAI